MAGSPFTGTTTWLGTGAWAVCSFALAGIVDGRREWSGGGCRATATRSWIPPDRPT